MRDETWKAGVTSADRRPTVKNHQYKLVVHWSTFLTPQVPQCVEYALQTLCHARDGPYDELEAFYLIVLSGSISSTSLS